MPTDSDDIEVLRNSIDIELAKYTWRLFACADDDAFEALWQEMVDELEGLGYDELFQFDANKWQAQVDAKIAAVAE